MPEGKLEVKFRSISVDCTGMEKILLLGHEREYGLRFVRILADAGLEPLADTWTEFHPRAYGRSARPALVLADTDVMALENVPPLADFCAALRKVWGAEYPVLATGHSTKFADVAAILDAGATAFLPKSAEPDRVAAKIARCLRPASAAPGVPGADDWAEEIPSALLGLFLANGSLLRLGDLADIYPGAASRSPRYRRNAPPDGNWRGVVGADAVDRFFAGRPSSYLLWSRFHLFRLPAQKEYSVPEKVLLSRNGPPLAAAVDRSRAPAGADVYSIVPKEDVSAGFLACVLNSRLMDFYFNRLSPPGTAGATGRLRLETLKAAPFPRPTEMLSQELTKAAALLSHFGPSPQSWIDRQSRDEQRRQMEETVFAAFGAGAEEKNSLAALHF